MEVSEIQVIPLPCGIASNAAEHRFIPNQAKHRFDALEILLHLPGKHPQEPWSESFLRRKHQLLFTSLNQPPTQVAAAATRLEYPQKGGLLLTWQQSQTKRQEVRTVLPFKPAALSRPVHGSASMMGETLQFPAPLLCRNEAQSHEMCHEGHGEGIIVGMKGMSSCQAE